MKISVIVTNYNQPLPKLLVTLESIVRQDIDDFEVLYSDDCSENSYEGEVELFFKARGFMNYKMVCNKQNLGTVKNILNAAEKADGKYIKVIGTGDLLYAPNELSDIYAFGESNNYSIFFGKVKTFFREEGILKKGDYNAPSNLDDFNKDSNSIALFNRQVLLGDWIPGGSLIYMRNVLIEYMTALSDDYGVVYVEDFVSTLALRDGCIGFFDADVLWYEWGVGISNSGNSKSRERMYADHTQFYEGLLSDDPNSSSLKKSYRYFKAKRFIALHLPALYSFAQKEVAKRYLGSAQQLSSSGPDTFLVSCIVSVSRYLGRA